MGQQLSDDGSFEYIAAFITPAIDVSRVLARLTLHCYTAAAALCIYKNTTFLHSAVKYSRVRLAVFVNPFWTRYILSL